MARIRAVRCGPQLAARPDRNRRVEDEMAVGTIGNDTLNGTYWADRIYGGAGNDLINAGAGNDSLYGGSGRDAIYGGSGTDLLIGGTGLDVLFGGSGSDAFVFDSRPPGDGFSEADVVRDFTSQDLLAIDNAVFPNLTVEGWLPSTMFKSIGSDGVVDSNDRLIYNERNGYLTYDWNGSASGGRVLIAELDGAPTLTAADIYIL
jgi:serralysin